MWREVDYQGASACIRPTIRRILSKLSLSCTTAVIVAFVTAAISVHTASSISSLHYRPPLTTASGDFNHVTILAPPAELNTYRSQYFVNKVEWPSYVTAIPAVDLRYAVATRCWPSSRCVRRNKCCETGKRCQLNHSISFNLITRAQQLLRYGRPFGHNRHGPKSGEGLLWGGWVPTGSPSNTIWPGGMSRSLPLYQVASWSIQPFGHNCRNATLLRVGIPLRIIFYP